MIYLFILLLSLSSTIRWAGANPGPQKAPARACNNAPELCTKPYDTITYLGAHDSPFIRDASTQFSSFGNQFFRTTTQLDAGVRLLSTQVHIAKNERTGKRELHVCHSSCDLFDAGPFRDWLLEIRLWMDANPYDVVTLVLVNMDKVDARELEGVYSEADIARYGYVPPKINKAPPPSNDSVRTWPTLDEMINRGERLVTFVNPLKPDLENAPYLLDEFTFLWENAFEVTDPRKFSCAPDRPQNQTIDGMRESGRLFLMNHLLYWQQAFGIQVPDIRVVHTTNGWKGTGSLGEHIVACSNEVRRQPTFILVDFFNVGPAIETVDIFNKIEKPVGRLSVTDQIIKGGAGFRSSAVRAPLNQIFVAISTVISVLGTMLLWA
jgi:hypothetical protein